MLRLLSILLFMAGLAALAWGGYRFYAGEQAAQEAPAMAEDQPFETRSLEMPPPPAPDGDIAAFEESAPEDGFGAGSGDDTFGVARTPNRMLERLRSVPIAHETPSEARFNRAFEVTLAIDATGDDSAADALPGDGNIVEGEAQILDKAQATLSGAAFDIELVSPSIQTVSPVTENVWRWRVTPFETGRHPLRLELFALENDEALPIRTFTDEVEVRVSRLGQVLATANTLDPVFMILGGAGSLLAGLFGVFRFFRGR